MINIEQIGTLAILCADRKDVQYTSFDGIIIVYAGSGPDRALLMRAKNNDAATINGVIEKLRNEDMGDSHK